MISRLKKLLEGRRARDDGAAVALDKSELNFASAALMVEAARLDGQIDDGERAQIVSIMVRQFSLDEDAAAALLDDAERDARAGPIGIHVPKGPQSPATLSIFAVRRTSQ